MNKRQHTIKKGLNYPYGSNALRLPSQEIQAKQVAVLASDFPGLKPKMLVAEGDEVSLGQPIIEDRQEHAASIVAPAGGKVVAIHRGARRRLLSVVIEVATKEKAVDLKPLKIDSPENIIEGLNQAGLLSSIRKRPYDLAATVNQIPEHTFIHAHDSAPGAFAPDAFIQAHQQDFYKGLEVLSAVTKTSTHVCWSTAKEAKEQSEKVPADIKVSHEFFSGPHPSGLPGTHINALVKVTEDSVIWSVDAQLAVSIGHFANTGKLLTERWFSVVNASGEQKELVKARIGVGIDSLASQVKSPDDSITIAGSVLFGSRPNKEEAFSSAQNSLVSSVAPAASSFFLGWGQLGTERFSKMPVFFPSSKSKILESNEYGNGRGLIPVEVYDSVMPLNLPTTLLLRSIVVGDTEKLQELGVLGLAAEDLQLLTFVCPSKYDYCSMFQENLDQIRQGG